MPCKRKLRRLIPAGWNERIFDEWDFYRFRDREDARTLDAETPLPGLYRVSDHILVIFNSRRVRGPERLRVPFQELGRHSLHYPNVQLFINLSSNVAQTIINLTSVERFSCVLPEMWD